GYVCSAGFSAWDPDGNPVLLTAGHCTGDGAYDTVGLSDPTADNAGTGDDYEDIGLSPSYDLGVYGFSQFGGPGNTPGNPGDTDLTDIAVIENINPELTLKPEVTDWSTPEDLSASTVKVRS